jgi:hypothetical protein
MGGALYPKRVEVCEKGVLELLGKFSQRNLAALATGDGLIIDVREVHDALDVVATDLQVALEKIFKNVRAKVSDVGKIVNSWATGIHLDAPPFGVQRFEEFESA